MPTAPLAIRTLGELAVLRGGEPVALPASRKSRALLGYLVATGRPHRRERLCALLWDGPDDPRAGLRWSLSKLRPIVDDPDAPRLVASGDQVGFEPRGAAVDLAEVRAATAAGCEALAGPELRALAGRFAGELLEGLDLDSFGFREWLAAERDAARRLECRVLEALVARLAGNAEEALPFARRRAVLEPASEEAHAAVIRLLHASGRSREALAQYDACREVLRKELGARPSRALEAARLGVPAASAAPRPSAAPASAAEPAASPALAGRRREREAVKRWLAEPRGLARVLLVCGDAGVGKSRLLEEVARSVAEPGGTVLLGRAYEAETVRPYGAFLDALRSVPPGSVPDDLRRDLAPLLPELGEPAGGDRHRLFDAVAAFVGGLAREGRPAALILDDLQWLDEASAALLHFVARDPRTSGLRVACGARSREMPDNPAALRLADALARDERVLELPLAPLTRDETEELVSAVAPGADAERVFAESEGNPLFALEILRTRGAPAEGATSLDRLLAGRLGRLDPAARTLLTWAAALGRRFALETLAVVADVSMAALLARVEELERRGFVRPAAGGAAGDYDFSHDLIRKAAYAAIPAPRRRQYHREIARVLESRIAADPALAGDVAHHAGIAGDLERAARACVAAGERCLKMFALQEAWDTAERGFSLASALPVGTQTQLPLQIDLIRVLVLSRTRREATERVRGMLDGVLAEAGRRGMPELMAQGFMVLSIINAEGGRYEEAEATANRAADAGRAASDARVASFAFAATGRCLVMLERDVPRARTLLAEARALAPADAGDGLELLLGLGLLAAFDGEGAQAAELLLAALSRARAQEDRWREYLALAYLARLALEAGEPATARERCRELLPVASRMGEGSERTVAEGLEALAARALSGPGESERLERALGALREVDTKADLGWALVCAGTLDLEEGDAARARLRAEEALSHAALLRRPSDEALARALLARALAAAGDRAAAREALAPLDAAREPLSARALAAVVAARALLDALPPGPSPEPRVEAERRRRWTT